MSFLLPLVVHASNDLPATPSRTRVSSTPCQRREAKLDVCETPVEPATLMGPPVRRGRGWTLKENVHKPRRGACVGCVGNVGEIQKLGGGKIDMKMKTNGSSSLELARRLLVRGIQVDIPEDDPHASSVLLQGVLIRQTGADFQSTVRFRNSTSTARASRQRSRSVIRTAKSRRYDDVGASCFIALIGLLLPQWWL